MLPDCRLVDSSCFLPWGFCCDPVAIANCEGLGEPVPDAVGSGPVGTRSGLGVDRQGKAGVAVAETVPDGLQVYIRQHQMSTGSPT
jgi:hypothetical protein